MILAIIYAESHADFDVRLLPDTNTAKQYKQTTTYLRNQHLVARLHRNSNSLALLVQTTGADGQHLCLIELLDAALGEEEAAGSLGLGFYPLHEDTVEEGAMDDVGVRLYVITAVKMDI